MDIAFKTSYGEFSLRSAALIIDDNKVLLAKHDKYDCFYTLGIEELENINLVPAFLKTAVKNMPNEVTHIVSCE